MTSVETANRLRIVSVQSDVPVQTGRGLVRRLTDGFVKLDGLISRFKQRRELSEMPDHVLRDIGVSRSDADQEARKPFWR